MAQYTVKAGDTLGNIGAANNTDALSLAKANNIADPNKIQVGAILNIPDATGPTTKEIPGLGTLTVTPKGLPSAPANTGTEDLSGAYARAGVTPPPVDTPVDTSVPGYKAPTVAGLPSYPSGVDTAGAIGAATKAYQTTLSTITDLESKIANAAVSSPEEKQLQQQLISAKAALNSFDLTTLSSEEALKGQGRGTTLGTINNQQTTLDRTRALQRLGLAQEADTITAQLGLAQDARKELGDVATTQYNLATKKLDMALGIQDKITSLTQDEQNNARQFLLDTVNFADGKSYDQLDPETQHAITAAVANSPITLDMVKTALTSGAEKASASADGRLYSVGGLGVVMVNADGSGYKVVVPESAGTTPTNNAPSFEDYVSAQNLPLPTLTPDKLATLRTEYDAKYGAGTVNLGKLTAEQNQNLKQGGLSGVPSSVQSYYLNTPAEFQQTYNRDFAAGSNKANPSLSDVVAAYTKWYNAKNTSGHDWSTILGTQ